VGQRIAVLREHARLSRRALGAEAGRSHTYIGKLERGEVEHPSANTLDRIARALGWSDYHAMMATDELAPAWTAQKHREHEEWLDALAELRTVVEEVRRDVRALLERNHRRSEAPPGLSS
jgi:transcriptional regulator with XRE-family HTH domain